MLCFEKHRKFYRSSKIFFIFFTLKHGKIRFQRWNCSYRASKSRGNTATEGWKRTGTFPLTFTFADKHSGCYGNGLIDVAEKFEFGACSIWIVEDVGRGSFLFPTYLGRSKETLFAGYSIKQSSSYFVNWLLPSLFANAKVRHLYLATGKIKYVCEVLITLKNTYQIWLHWSFLNWWRSVVHHCTRENKAYLRN